MVSLKVRKCIKNDKIIVDIYLIRKRERILKKKCEKFCSPAYYKKLLILNYMGNAECTMSVKKISRVHQ